MGDDESTEEGAAIDGSLQKEFFADLISRIVPGVVVFLILFDGDFSGLKDFNNWEAGLAVTVTLILSWVAGCIVDIISFQISILIMGEGALLKYHLIKPGCERQRRLLEKDMAEMAMFRNLTCILLVASIISWASNSICARTAFFFIGALISGICWRSMRWRSKRAIALAEDKYKHPIIGVVPWLKGERSNNSLPPPDAPK